MSNKVDNIIRHAKVSEKAIERYLSERCKALGGVSLKYSNANMAGYPDRVCLLPNGRTIWVELKSKGKHPSKLQQIRIAQLESLGHHVYVADNKETVDQILEGRRDDI